MISPRSRLALVLLAAVCVIAAAGRLSSQPLTAALPDTVEIRDMTWVEVRAAIQQGYKTVLVPTGGIEQNGPHMVLGKHDYIVGWAAREVAKAAGGTLVAPVLSYVPEGEYEPATGHMRFPGTLGVSGAAFAGMLEGIARSLKVHGFTLICFIGDHGESLPVQRAVAGRLSKEWERQGVRAASLDAYYDDSAQVKRLEAEGETRPPSASMRQSSIPPNSWPCILPAPISTRWRGRAFSPRRQAAPAIRPGRAPRAGAR